MKRQLTKQEIFDKVLTHFRKQRESSQSGRTCLYRGPNGTSCAVGCLISDEDYVEDIEKIGVTSITMLKAGHISYHTYEATQKILLLEDILVRTGVDENLPLLEELQYIHDNGFDNGFAYVEYSMRLLARQWELAYVEEIL